MFYEASPSLLTPAHLCSQCTKPCSVGTPLGYCWRCHAGQVHYSVGDNTSLIVSGVTTESMTQRNETEEGEVLTQKEQNQPHWRT